jgi:hypothetical protein
MGEAKRRGTYEQRKAEAIARDQAYREHMIDLLSKYKEEPSVQATVDESAAGTVAASVDA